MDYPSPWQLLCVHRGLHDAQLCFARLFRQLRSITRKSRKLLRNFQEVRNNLETIEKLFRNY